jgi:hypothetical protein
MRFVIESTRPCGSSDTSVTTNASPNGVESTAVRARVREQTCGADPVVADSQSKEAIGSTCDRLQALSPAPFRWTGGGFLESRPDAAPILLVELAELPRRR